MAKAGEEDLDESLHDEYFDIKCIICARKNQVKEAKKFCRDCRKNLCLSCVETHNDFYEGHILVDGHGIEIDKLSEQCEQHQDEAIQLFCVDHDDLACTVCVSLHHRNCQELKYIAESAADLCSNDPNILNVTEELKSALKHVDQVINVFDLHKEMLLQQEQSFLEEIENYAEKLLYKIKQLQRNAQQKVTTKHHCILSNYKKKRDTCVASKEVILKCMENIRKAGKSAHQFIIKKKGIIITQNVAVLCRESKEMMKRYQMAFVPDRTIGSCFNDFISLGNLEEKYKTSLIGIMNVAETGESIRGCCQLQDGTMLLAEWTKSKLKHVDPSLGTETGCLDLHGDLRGITCISQNEVAVCKGDDKCLQIVSLSKKLTPTRKIKLNHASYSIATCNTDVYVSDTNCIYVYSLTWMLIRTICHEAMDKNLSEGITGIALSPSGNCLYMTHWSDGLISMDKQGIELFKCSCSKLGISEAAGVCTDQHGNVMVSGRSSCNVVQVMENGHVMGEILTEDDGLQSPTYLCCNTNSKTLYVMTLNGGKSNIMMFQLQ